MPRNKTTHSAPADMPEVLPARALAINDAQDQVVREELALEVANAGAKVLAQQLGYDGALTVGALEDGIRFYQRRTVEAILETGKRLVLLKDMTPHGEFSQRVEMLGFAKTTAFRFMQAAMKTAKSSNLELLSSQVKSASAFLELVTHDDDTLEALQELDNIDRMSASQLRAALRQAEQDTKFAAEKRAKAEDRADKAEKRLAGNRPLVVPLDERITPFQVEITERQSLVEKGVLAHLQALEALDAWWLEEVVKEPGYDAESRYPMPRAVGAVVLHLDDAAARLAAMVGKLQHSLQERFGDDIAEARQHLLQDAEAAGV